MRRARTVLGEMAVRLLSAGSYISLLLAHIGTHHPGIEMKKQSASSQLVRYT